jgi:hypothetical protein
MLGVVKQAEQPQKRHHGGNLVQDEKGDHVRDGGAAQAGRVALQRGGEAGEDAGEAVLGLGVWGGVRGGVGGVWLFSWMGLEGGLVVVVLGARGWATWWVWVGG